MTTVAFDGKTFASDSRITADFIDSKPAKKLFEIGDFIIGVAGEYASCMRFIEAFKESTSGKSNAQYVVSNFTALVYDKKQKKLYRYDDMATPFEVGIPYSIGSGSSFAMGAMYNGATAEGAVKVAIKLDVNSGSPVRSIKVK